MSEHRWRTRLPEAPKLLRDIAVEIEGQKPMSAVTLGLVADDVEECLRADATDVWIRLDGEDTPNWRVVGCPNPNHGTRAVDLNGDTPMCSDCRVLGPDGAPLGLREDR